MGEGERGRDEEGEGKERGRKGEGGRKEEEREGEEGRGEKERRGREEGEKGKDFNIAACYRSSQYIREELVEGRHQFLVVSLFCWFSTSALFVGAADNIV